MSATPWKIYEGKKPDDEPELEGKTMPELEVVAQRPMENKTELNADGTPKQTTEAEPDKFTVGEEKIGMEPANANVNANVNVNGNPTTDVMGTEAAGTVAIDPATIRAMAANDLQEQEYLKAHPWVLEEDYSNMRNKYKDKKWSQIVNDVAAYREQTGKPMSQTEMANMLMQYNPNTSKKEEVREKRLAYWADALNQLGNVLAHIYNYGRAKGGSPAAQIPDNKTSYSERLKAADTAMRQRGYNDYVNAMVNEQKRKQTREDMEYGLRMQEVQEQRRLANQMELKRMEWMSPKYKKELERLDLDLQDKQVQKELHELQKAFQMMKNDTAKDHAFEMFVRKNSGKGGGSKTPKPYTYNGIGYTNEYLAYKDAMIAQGKQPMKHEAWEKQKDKRKLLKDAGVTIHGVD